MKRKTFQYLLVGLLLSAFYMACKKDNPDSIPLAPVNIYIYTSDPSFVSLNAVGGWTYISGGVKGIIVFRKSPSEFMAYDRNCTFNPTSNCATVSVDNSNIIAKDTCCGSQFLLNDGSVLKGPAALALKTYNTTFDGSVLHIYN